MKYPVGIQDFRELREGGYVYIDKTEYICHILEAGKYYLLTRPRRFGKSLLLSTINELYSGSRELFSGLWAERNWDWEGKRRPVIWLRFASFQYKHNPLKAAIEQGLQEEAARLGVELPSSPELHPLNELLKQVNEHYSTKAVLLIDEYDKPIIDYLDDVPQAEDNRDTLKWLYSVLKDNDARLELLFVTGVSAFSKVSIFSDLNNLTNLSLHRFAHTLLGITQQGLGRYFAEQLATLDAEQVKRWYNGYSWGGPERVYNPFSLLSFLQSGEFRNFWFETGTPTFLLKEMKKHAYYDVAHTLATSADLSNFDLRRLNPVTVLFQTGYLTVERYEPADLLYTLDYPNLEVKHSLQQVLLNEYLDYPRESGLPRVVALRNALQNKDLSQVVEIINAAFAEIPGELWRGKTEHFYHAVAHLMFSLLGTYIQSEARSAKGRCDALVQTAEHIYAFEFKLDKSAAAALAQIRDRGYLAPFTDSPKAKIAVGINFSSEERRVTEWEVEEH
jgi:hypothetical protein